MSHRESRHVPTQETGQGLLLVIPADTMVGVMGTEPPPAALHEALRGTGQRQEWLLFSVLGQTWPLGQTRLLCGPPKLQALSPSQGPVPVL